LTPGKEFSLGEGGGRLGLNYELCLLLHLSLLELRKIYWKKKEKEVWIDKGWVFLRENKAKVVTINVNC